MVGVVAAVLVAVLLVQRVVELRIAKRNEAWAKEQGAREFGAKHYPLFFVLHGGWAVGWILETKWDGPELPAGFFVFAVLFVAAQGLRYWAIRSLGRRWNTRVLVLPSKAPLVGGPYGFIRHPNYLAVVIELAAVPLMVGAVWTAAAASVLNLLLLKLIRIPCEEKALAWAEAASPPPATRAEG